ncbi:hypothetical protein [Ancylobacter terrae]|uniref:hypothetical protein n=1 Tax=Ancylobacter sp. sgz301288 TaxID=3342077 RepID=UPI00385B5289
MSALRRLEKTGLLSTVSPEMRGVGSASRKKICPKFAALEARRIAAGATVMEVCSRAQVAERAYRRARLGIVAPRASTLRRLETAIEQLGREAGRDPAELLPKLWVAILAMVAIDMGVPPAIAVAADPHANLKGDAQWRAAAEVRHRALYLLVTVHDVSMAAAAGVAGISKQAVSKALRGIEDDRDDERADRGLEMLAAPFEVAR